MASNHQLSLMTDLLDLPGMKVIDYRLKDGIGIIVSLEKQKKKAICPECGSATDKLHQNHRLTIKDLPISSQAVYLQINRRRWRCLSCGNKFSEELEFLKKKRTYTERFKRKIIAEVIESDIKNVGRRNDVSEQEIETMLKDVGEELKAKKPNNLKKLGIDEIAVVKGQGNYYVVLVDMELGIPVGFVEKRTEESSAVS